MGKKKMKVGALGFLVAIGGALLLGLLAAIGVYEAASWMWIILVLAGIVVGLINVSEKEANSIMIAALVLGVGAGVFAILPIIGEGVGIILTALASVALPIGMVVAVKTLIMKAQ